MESRDRSNKFNNGLIVVSARNVFHTFMLVAAMNIFQANVYHRLHFLRCSFLRVASVLLVLAPSPLMYTTCHAGWTSRYFSLVIFQSRSTRNLC